MPTELFRTPGIQTECESRRTTFLVTAAERQSAPAFTVIVNWQSNLEHRPCSAVLHAIDMTPRNVFWLTTLKDRNLSSISQAGLVNNLNDGMAWGLFPLFFAASGMSLQRIAVLATIYRAVWGVVQLATGALLGGISADLLGLAGAMWIVAGVTFVSGWVTALRMRETLAPLPVA